MEEHVILCFGHHRVDEHFGSRGQVAAEVSPTDLTPEVVRNLRDVGITQISVGVQTFDEKVLFENLGRRTRRDDILRGLRAVTDAGFEYVNIDLMFSLEGQSVASIQEDFASRPSWGCTASPPTP